MKKISFYFKNNKYLVEKMKWPLLFIIFIFLVYGEKYSYYEATRIRDSIEISMLSQNLHLKFDECLQNHTEIAECISNIKKYTLLTKPSGIIEIYDVNKKIIFSYDNTKDRHKDRELVIIPQKDQRIAYKNFRIIVQKHSKPNILEATFRAITLSVFDIAEKMNSVGYQKTIEWYMYDKIYLRSQFEFIVYSLFILFYIISIIRNKRSSLNMPHYPQKLVKLLTNFTVDKPMKYTTHSWDFGDLKKEYGSFEEYLKAVKTQWNSIKDELEQLSPNLYQKVHNFLWEHDDVKALGWSSIKGLKEWCDNGNDPFGYQIGSIMFGEIKDTFKNVIEIRKEQDKLEDIFIQERKKLGRDFKIELVKLKGKTFYTDVEKFKSSIAKIFSANVLYSKDNKGSIVYPNIRVEAIEDENNKFIEIHIIHMNSFASSNIKDMITETSDGDFADIKNNLQNLCDWSIQNGYEDENYQINYLKTEHAEEIENIEEKPRGFTHILRFYNR